MVFIELGQYKFNSEDKRNYSDYEQRMIPLILS